MTKLVKSFDLRLPIFTKISGELFDADILTSSSSGSSIDNKSLNIRTVYVGDKLAGFKLNNLKFIEKIIKIYKMFIN